MTNCIVEEAVFKPFSMIPYAYNNVVLSFFERWFPLMYLDILLLLTPLRNYPPWAQLTSSLSIIQLHQTQIPHHMTNKKHALQKEGS